MANKVCKRDYFSAIRTVIEANPELRFGTEKFPEMPVADVLAFIDNELSLLNSKSGALKKPTKTQEANIGLREGIRLWFMNNPNERITVSQMCEKVECCVGLSTQKISPQLSKLVEEDILIREKDKSVIYYKLA